VPEPTSATVDARPPAGALARIREFLRTDRPIHPQVPSAFRENVEALATAVVLALIIRHYMFEAFKIPTGSMAPTLLGQHKDLQCPNCGMAFAVDGGYDRSGSPKVVSAMCPNCGYPIDEATVAHTLCRCFPSWPRQLFWRGGHRILVNKFLHRFEPPRRWDVVVFVYPRTKLKCRHCGEEFERETWRPGDRCPYCESTQVKRQRVNYIKRLIGLPGDRVSIRNGDIYVNGHISRKTPRAQEALWLHVYDSRLREKDPAFNPPLWRALRGELREDGGRFALKPGPDGRAEAAFTKRIIDYSWYNGRPRSPGHVVGDVRLDFRARMDQGRDRALSAWIMENDNVYRATIALGAHDNSNGPAVVLTAQGRAVAEADLALDPRAEHRVRFWNADDAVVLEVDGQRVLRYEYELPAGIASLNKAGVGFGVEGAGAVFRDVRVYRDVYYTRRAAEPFYHAVDEAAHVPDDHFFMLGDNSLNSHDGRAWGFVPRRNLIGKAFLVFWPVGALKDIE